MVGIGSRGELRARRRVERATSAVLRLLDKDAVQAASKRARQVAVQKQEAEKEVLRERARRQQEKEADSRALHAARWAWITHPSRTTEELLQGPPM